MNSQRLLFRKIAYFSAISLLLIPLAILGQPESSSSPGGHLAQLRKEYNLSQAQIGEIDPTSETIKLATFGLRGVAAMVLWSKASHYKDVKDWTSFDATLSQLTKVMPNSIGVWRYQAWNVSYNISVEFDDFRQRYVWVIKGIDFLKEGVKHNAHEPRLHYDLGWFHNHKIGKADEVKEFRRMFFEEFHRDNWLVGRDYYLQAQRMVDQENIKVKGITPVIFHSRPAMAQMQYAGALQEDGVPQRVIDLKLPTLMEKSKISLMMDWKKAWVDAYRGWEGGNNSLGDRDMFADEGIYIRLKDLDVRVQEIKESLDQLEKIQPGLIVKMLNHPAYKWTPNYQKALDTPIEKQTAEQKEMFEEMLLESVYKLNSPFMVDFMSAVDEKNKVSARKIRQKLLIARTRWRLTQEVQEIINYQFWKVNSKSQAEQSALLGQYYLALARTARQQGRFITAKRYYEDSFAQQKLLFDQYPFLLENDKSNLIIGDDTVDLVIEYRDLLKKDLDLPFPKDFVFNELIRENDYDNEFNLGPIPGSTENADTGEKEEPAKANKKEKTSKKSEKSKAAS